MVNFCVIFSSLHPGAVRTELLREVNENPFMKVVIILTKPIYYLCFKSSL
jgi:hypothetical protein